MSKTTGNDSKLAHRVSQQQTRLNCMPKTQLVVKTTAPPKRDFEKERQMEYEEQRAVWSLEGFSGLSVRERLKSGGKDFRARQSVVIVFLTRPTGNSRCMET